MSRRVKRGDIETFGLSFLDVICCGFGAIILLLVLTKIGEPMALEQAREDLDARLAALQEEIFEIRGQVPILNRQLEGKQEQLSDEKDRIARLQGDLTRIQGEFMASQQFSEVNDILEGRMLAAHQELTEEMKRLLAQAPRRKETNNLVGGIPVDSEYVIFVIDTSGSMINYAWPLVQRKMSQVLDIYPSVKGIQVMNDMGQYMFSRYAGKWIPDTPARRKAILQRLSSWNAFSNSSPVEGITRAIRTFAPSSDQSGKKISIYVFGDEFTGNSIDSVLATVDRMNKKDRRGNRRVRIHAIGFPVMFSVSGAPESTGVRFATLMRLLTRQNGGTFVALNSTRR